MTYFDLLYSAFTVVLQTDSNRKVFIIVGHVAFKIKD